MSTGFGKRYADRFHVTRAWERIKVQTSFQPRKEITGSLPERIEDKILADIVEHGIWLQHAVAERWALASELADALSKHAGLDRAGYGDSSRERIAAAYMLWPYHSARYYGYLSVGNDERLTSRTALCQIQGILYNNIRGVMDVLRLWFHSHSDAETREYVARPDSNSEIPGKRSLWRPKQLTENVPDLCAIDHLVEDLMGLIRARPKIRQAIETIQKLSVKDLDPSDVSKIVLGAFNAVRIAQMTVFYHPNPADVRDRDDIPLFELVHETRDMDPIPAKLIPFGTDERLAQNFRKLASTIYSVQNKSLFPNFSAHRYSTINRLDDTTSFISDGEITNYFLSTRPPVQIPNENGDGGALSPSQSLWPLWYKQTLSDFDFDKQLPDWSDHFWWNGIGHDELRKRLFPEPQDGASGLHENHHMSSYWDYLAGRNTFLDKIDIPREHPTGEPTFGYLMELLLREEHETRTSFFFALAQTYEKQGRLCQFVGGTFLGLEMPGVPFSRERFEAIAGRVRGLVMAVAHYTTTHAYKTVRWLAAQERSNFSERVSLIGRLLKGDAKDRRFHRNGHLLFATPIGGGQTDHDYRPHDSQGWKPSLYQIKSVFTTANHLSELPRSSKPKRGCYDTWKALFYLGGTADIHNRLSTFRQNWHAYQTANPSARTDMADRSITCKECFGAAIEFLLSEEMYASLKPRIEISDPAIDLPSRPGIRFLITLCRFIVDLESQASPDNTQITRIDFNEASVVMDFDKPKLLEKLWEKKKHGMPNFVHTTGIFMLLEESTAVAVKGDRDAWGKFLNDPHFARPLTITHENEWQRLVIAWQA